MTQSSSCAGTGLLEFRAVESGRVSHLRTDRDKARQIERATATLGGGRLPTLLFDCIQRVYASTPEGVSHVLGLSEGLSKLIAIDKQPNHQIVHLFRLGKTNRAAH
jgi:hypothetical protein